MRARHFHLKGSSKCLCCGWFDFFTFVLGYDDVREGIAYKREGGAHRLTLGCTLKFLVSLKVLRKEKHCFSSSGIA